MPRDGGHYARVVLAWVLLLVGSNLAGIVTGGKGHRTDVAQTGILLAVSAAVSFSPVVRPLRGFALALAALDGGDLLRWWIESSLSRVSTASLPARVFADAVLAGIPALLMIGVAVIGSGLRIRQVFLVPGDMNARTSLPFLSSVRWSRVGPAIFVLTALPLALQLRLVAGPGNFSRIGIAGAAAAVAFAAINAGFEEIRFRFVLLAQSEPVVGSAQAIWLTSVLFGLAHWGGHPAGVSGVLMAGFLGWLLATSILDTRGGGWAWLIHVGEDIVIFLSIVATGR
jgi:membrane protease YdiL (CAAX protease family)